MFSARGTPTLPRGASCAGRPSRSNSTCSLNSNKFGTCVARDVLPAPFSQRLPVMKRRCLPVSGSRPKSLMVSKHAFAQCLHRTVLWLGSSAFISSIESMLVCGTLKVASSPVPVLLEPSGALSLRSFAAFASVPLTVLFDSPDFASVSPTALMSSFTSLCKAEGKVPTFSWFRAGVGALDSAAPRPQRTSLRKVEGKAEGKVPTPARSRARRAAPYAPIHPAISGRTASTSASCSNERNTASFKNVPPCTITLLPTSCGSRILITLNSAFLITESARPAAMSPTVAPSFCACFTRLFMNTVQRLPKSTGFWAAIAVLAKSATSKFKPLAKLSMKLPQPEEHASFNMMCSITPSFTRKHFMSCPPMSKMNSTPGSISCAPRKCATVSISPESMRNAESSSPSP